MAATKPFRVALLTSSPHAGRFARFNPSADADPWREYRLLGRNGMHQVLRDRNRRAWNPFRHPFYAGFDPLRALRVLCFDRRADLVLCAFENTAFLLLLLRRLFRFKPPIAIIDVSPLGWRPRDFVLGYVMPRVDLVLTLTEAQARYAGSTWTLRRPPVPVGGLIDEAFFRPQPAAEPGRPYVLAVGDDHSRDYGTLITACATLGCDLVLKTGLPVEVPDPMRDRVRLIRDRLSGAELRALYAGARAVAVPIVPTDNPGGISSLLEAMAMGRPVVAAATAMSSELLADGSSGLLVPPRDPEAMHRALRAVLEDAGLAARLGAAARRTVERDYAMPVRQSRMVAALRRLCARPEPAALSPATAA